MEAVRHAHREAGITVEEGLVFKERHQRTNAAGEPLPHLNALVRAAAQYAWLGTARNLMELYRIRVDFASHIKTWVDGVIYGYVRSEHKPEEELDRSYYHWVRAGSPLPLEEVLPRRLRNGGGRQTRLTPLAAYDLCRQHSIKDTVAAWAMARTLEAQGDRGLLAFLLECRDVDAFVGKVRAAEQSVETQRRERVGRIGLLREAAAGECSCAMPGLWQTLADQTLQRNGIGGDFEKAIYTALLQGRSKKTNVFLLGPTNAAKSFLVKPLSLLLRCYTVPDGGNYQLEALVDKELLYLNGFSWDEKWLKWSYFKTLLEGAEAIMVARPKNKGGDVPWARDCPVIGTCSAQIQLFCRTGRAWALHEGETAQMNSRVQYFRMEQSLAEEAIIQCAPCMKCAAAVYLRGAPATRQSARDRSRSR